MIRQNIPDEVLMKVLNHLGPTAASCLKRKIPKYWQKRVLKITSRRELTAMLQDPFYKNATILDISNINVDDLDLEFISFAFNRIKSISLVGCCDMSDDGVMALVSRHGKALKNINLGRCPNLTNISLENISQYCDNLRRLDLSSSFFSSSGLAILARNERLCNKLVKLSLKRCYVLDVSELPTILPAFKSLRSLNLSDMDSLQSHYIEAILRELKLKELDIRGCSEFTLKDISNFQNFCPSLIVKNDARLEDHTHDAGYTRVAAALSWATLGLMMGDETARDVYLKESTAKFDALLQKKYKTPRDTLIDKEIFLTGIEVLRLLDSSCIWCRLPRVAGELLRLLSFPDNQASTWFSQKCRESLSSCADCLDSYYSIRPELKVAFGQLFEVNTLLIFWQRVHDFDVERIHSPLKAFLSGVCDARSSALLFGLYELLLYPRHFESSVLLEIFRKVLTSLVSTRKMIKVNQILPGIIYCLLDKEESTRQWAITVLKSSSIEQPQRFLPGSIDISKLIGDSKCPFLLQNLPLLIKSLPSAIEDADIASLFLFLTKAAEDSFYFKDAILGIVYLEKKYPGKLRSIESLGSISPKTFSLIIADESVEMNTFCVILEIFLSHRTELESKISHLIGFMTESFLKSSSSLHSQKILLILSSIVSDDTNCDLLCSCNLETFRLLSLVSDQVTTTPHLPELVKICGLLDMRSAKSSGDFRAFAQLFIKLLSIDSSLWLEFARVLVNSKLKALNYLQRRSNMLNSIVAAFPISLAGRSQDSMSAFICFALSSDSSVEIKLSHAFTSYPELFSYGIRYAVDLVAQLAQSAWRIKLVTNLKHIILRTYLSDFFTSPTTSSNIAEMFPNQANIYSAIIYSCLQLTIMEASEDVDSAVASSCKILSFANRVLPLVPNSGHSLIFKGMRTDFSSLQALSEKVLKCFSDGDAADANMTHSVLTLILSWFGELKLKINASMQKLIIKVYDKVGFTSGQRQSLSYTIDVYEKRTKCLVPRPSSKSPDGSIVRFDNFKTTRSKDIIDLSIEEKILREMRSAEGQLKERSFPISLRSPAIPVFAKTGSLVSQLRQEAVKDAANHPHLRSKRRAGIESSLAGLRKPEKINPNASSASDSECEIQLLKERFTRSKVEASGPPQLSRSVKLIDIANTKPTDPKPGQTKFENTLKVLDVDFVKKFHKSILSFTLHDIGILPEDSVVSSVPNTFESPQEYISIFEPLLYIECRAQLAASMDEALAGPHQSLKIVSVGREDCFHEVTLQSDADDELSRVRITDHDYLLVQFIENSQQVPAVVIQSSLKVGVLEATIRMMIPIERASLQIELREGLKLTFKKIGNVVTNFREYMAMMCIGNINLCPSLLKADLKAVQIEHTAPEVLSLCQSQKINQSQAKAILAVVRNINPITLIQGPPGTGKTKTIESLLSVLFVRSATGVLSKPSGGKVLICAPSNAAIDEIVRRVRQGLTDRVSGRKMPIKLLRVGSLDMISEDVKDLTVESQVDRASASAVATSSSLLDSQRKACDELRRRLNNVEKSSDASEIKTLKTALWEAKEALRKNQKFIEDARNTVRQKVLNEAQIVCCTLSSSGHDLISRLDFEIVIIDEACQAVELSCIVPMMHNCRQCILVGDPNQLPPTVISQMAGVFSYSQSLFVRLQKQCPESVCLLDTQYRMHPEISRFPNYYFYSGRLIDGENTTTSNIRPWHTNDLLGPFRFIDISGREESRQRDSGTASKSKMNELEAQVAANLIAMICLGCPPNVNMFGKIGVVTPYKDQRRALRREIVRRFGSEALNSVEVSTVDGFQGQEREVIIFSCVRTGESSGIGFLNDTRRLNVALTRAKCSLFVLGKATALYRNPIWKAMVDDAKSRKCFVTHENSLWASVAHTRTLPNLNAPVEVAIKGESDPFRSPSAILTPAERRQRENNRSSIEEARSRQHSSKDLLDTLLDRGK